MSEAGRFTIPPQSGRAMRVRAGERIRIIDAEGRQVADFWAIVTDGELDWISAAQTRDIAERLFPAVGEGFYGTRGDLLVTFVEDGSAGRHDMLFPACDNALYVRAGLHDHPNCHDNFLAAIAGEGVSLPVVPDPVDFFQNSPPQADGRLEVLASVNPPGGYVVLRAERDLLIVVTACSVDFHPTNGGVCTRIAVEVLPPA